MVAEVAFSPVAVPRSSMKDLISKSAAMKEKSDRFLSNMSGEVSEFSFQEKRESIFINVP